MINGNLIEQTLSSMEVAEMMKMAHKNILRKIEGRDEKGKHIDGALDIISRAQLEPSDYFIKSFYVNSRGKEYPAYNCTRKGCEFLAHKFQGAKGIEFTIAYIERFHQMEEALKEVIAEKSSPELAIGMSKYPAPIKVTKWYDRNAEKISAICKRKKINYSELYSTLLTIIGWSYDMDAAREIYYHQKGYYPKQPMDIVEFFPEFQKIADEEIEWFYKMWR